MRWVLFLMLLFGCTRNVYTPIVRSHRIVDTVVSQVADSAMIRALFECDSLGNVLLCELSQSKGKMAKQDFNFSDNELRLETRWQTKFVDRIVETRDTVTVIDVQRIEIEKPYVPVFFWWCTVIAVVSCLGWGVKLYRKFLL